MTDWFFSKPKHDYIMVSPETRLRLLEAAKPSVYALLTAALRSGARVNGFQLN